MKKILLATTALVGFTGAAAAEVTLSGYAEIGIAGGDVNPVQFWDDFDVTFTLSGETDSGLSFGATMDLDEVGDDCGTGATIFTNTSTIAGVGVCQGGDGIFANGGGDTEEHSVWVSGSFGKVSLGDIDGAVDWAVPEIYMGTALADDFSTHAGAYWNTGLDGIYDGQVARYDYSFGDFGVAFSMEMDDGPLGSSVVTVTTTGGSTFTTPYVYGDPAWGLGFNWTGDLSGTTVSAGIGYQSNGSLDVVALGVDVDLTGGFSFNLGYADGNLFASNVDTNWWGIAAGYQTGPMLFQVNWGEYSDDQANGYTGTDGWGFVANYDLGGGAVAMLGYGNGDGVGGLGGGDTSTWSAGLGLSF